MPDDRDDDYTRTRRPADSAAVLYAVLGVGLVVLVAAAGGVATLVYMRGRAADAKMVQVQREDPKVQVVMGETTAARPAADKEGIEWNHADLLAHLNKSHQTGFVMFPDRPAFAGRGPSAWFVLKGTEHATSGTQAEVGFQYGYPEVLTVSVEPDAGAARDAAGPHGDRAFAWGRFVVRSTEAGKDSTLAAVRKALVP